MANGGWYGTREEWERLEAPLKSIDSALSKFAARHDLNLSENHKDWPERSLQWGGGIRCLMQIYLAKEEQLTFNFWICASEDRGLERFWQRQMLIENEEFSRIANRLEKLLEAGKQKLDYWHAHPETLEFATRLSPL